MNIDRQAWLGEEVLAEPRPDMFRAQQLQVRECGPGRELNEAEAGADPGAEPERRGVGQGTNLDVGTEPDKCRGQGASQR